METETELVELLEPIQSDVVGGVISRRRTDDHAILSQLMNDRRRLEEMNMNWMSCYARMHKKTLRMLQSIDQSIKQLAMQSIARSNSIRSGPSGTSVSAPTESNNKVPVKLSKNPKDLYTLWTEYEFGISGSKAAKLSTPIERGANKFSYSRRKIFWDVVSNMVRKGFTSDAAIAEIYNTYGAGLSVSKILLQLRNDRRTGGHPNLS